MMMRKKLGACCSRYRELSVDFDELQLPHQQQLQLHDRVMTYNGLESCILNSYSYRNECGARRSDGCVADSLDEDDTSCSSSRDAYGSFFSQWVRDDGETDEWDVPQSPRHFYFKEKPAYVFQFSDIESMKEKFAKLLLGEDITGGRKGITTSLALSHAITKLAASVFGELWKLEPLSEDRKTTWRKEMDWLLSPANYMVELVPAKQCGSNFEIMTPKARADIHMNLPALQKLDSMLIDTLDSMVKTEFWYAEGGSSRNEGRGASARQSRRWWFPSPRVLSGGLSETARKKLLSQGNMVHQVLKAAKSINETILGEMPVPKTVKDALPKSGRVNLGEGLYKLLSSEPSSSMEILDSLKLKSEHEVLDTINKLEIATVAWRDEITERVSTKSPVRASWSFIKDTSEVDKLEPLLSQAEALLWQLKMRYPHLPHTFLDATKIQYGKDVGHAILEAYSRVIGNVAYMILSRIRDVLQADLSSNPNSPVANCCFPGLNLNGVQESPVFSSRARRSLDDRMNKVDGYFSDSNPSITCSEISSSDAKTCSTVATPTGSRIWCIGTDGCSNDSACNSPFYGKLH